MALPFLAINTLRKALTVHLETLRFKTFARDSLRWFYGFYRFYKNTLLLTRPLFFDRVEFYHELILQIMREFCLHDHVCRGPVEFEDSCLRHLEVRLSVVLGRWAILFGEGLFDDHLLSQVIEEVALSSLDPHLLRDIRLYAHSVSEERYFWTP